MYIRRLIPALSAIILFCLSAEKASAKCPRLLKSVASVVGLASYSGKSTGVIRLTRGKEIPTGEYVYVMTDGGEIFVAPRVTASGNIQGHLQLYTTLKAKPGKRLAVVGAGEIIVREPGAISEINNRSGTFLPGTTHLNYTVARLRELELISDSRRIRIGDYSVVSENHPLYVKNSILDVSHTIVAVEKIGKKKFTKSLKAANPLKEIRGLMAEQARPAGVPASKNRFIPPDPVTTGELKAYVEDHGYPIDMREARSENPQVEPAVSFKTFENAFQTLRKDGQAFYDVEDFIRFYAKHVEEGDEINATYTQLEITTQVRSKEEAKAVTTFVVGLDRERVLITNDDYHNTYLEYWGELLNLENGWRGIYEHVRGGILIVKSKKSKKIDVWLMDQRVFRHHGVDILRETPDFSYPI